MSGKEARPSADWSVSYLDFESDEPSTMLVFGEADIGAALKAAQECLHGDEGSARFRITGIIEERFPETTGHSSNRLPLA